MQFFLRFHDHTILVTCNEREVLEKLQDEFHFFISEADEVPATTIDLCLGESPEIPALVADKVLEHVTIYHLGHRQFFDYSGEALTIRDHLEDNLKVYSKDVSRLHELGFLAIHSLLGLNLERRGYFRIHSVAVSYKHRNILVMLPSKGGKSTLLTQFLNREEVKIISDDMPLVDSDGLVHPFPSKIGLAKVPDGKLSTLRWTEFKRTQYPPKWVASLSQLKDRLETKSAEYPTILVAGYRLSRGASFVQEVSRWKMLRPVLEHMIIGIGLPQVIELFLRFDLTDFFLLPKHFVLRSIAAYHLVRKSRCYYLYLGSDPATTAEVVLGILHED